MQPTHNANTSQDRISPSINEALRKKQSELWLAENKEAIAAYNTHVEKHGVFSDGLRSF